MTTYIGEIPIYYISSFNTDQGSKKIDDISFLGPDAIPYLSESKSNIREFNMTGTLLQDNGVNSDIDDMAEDLLALKHRIAAFNYIHDFQGRSGWIGLKDVNSPKDSHSLVTRLYRMEGRFLSKALYQARMHSYPIIRPNDFSFTLGVDDCDNYIAIPIGATYLGGDGSTINRTSKDGTITLISATLETDVAWDIGEDDKLNGECKVFDEKGVAEANWVQVYARDREFIGKVVIENALYRIIFDPSTNYITFYYWSGSAYTKIDDFISGDFNRPHIIQNNPDKIKIGLNSLFDDNVTQILSDTSYLLNAGEIPVTIENTDAAGSFDGASQAVIGQTIDCGAEGIAIIDSVSVYYDTIGATTNHDCKIYDKFGGTLLATKKESVTGTGLHTFTFTTPVVVAKDDVDCASPIFYITCNARASIACSISKGTAYSGGTGYINGVDQSEDIYFKVNGHSAKEVNQTFQIAEDGTIDSVIIKGCDYNYAGSNVWTAKIYQSTTLLGTGTTNTPGASFDELKFKMSEESTGSLDISGLTEYILKIYPPSDSINANSVLIQSKSSSVYGSGAVTLIEDGGTDRTQTHDLYFKINLVPSYEEVLVTLYRGHPPFIDTNAENLLCTSLTPSDQSTSTENYLILGTNLYICSDRSFSIVAATKKIGVGKKWIFYETNPLIAEDIAHQAMVDARSARELIQR